MDSYISQNKRAWEYNAYEFWCSRLAPEDLARAAVENPLKQLRRFASYFDAYEGVKVANICGSCGKKAIPLALLGAQVTVFDISRDNQRYALEAAAAAQIHLDYQVCDVLSIDLTRYGETFDVVFMEGGILHYFHDIDQFMAMMHALLKPGGRMICSDFHPLGKVADVLHLEHPTMSYFDTDIHEFEMAHARFFPDEIRRQMPKCRIRKYTLSEILNGVMQNGFTLRRFDEHPAWEDSTVPGEFALVAEKC